MTETPPPRRALATFLRRPGTERPAATPSGEPPVQTSADEAEPATGTSPVPDLPPEPVQTSADDAVEAIAGPHAEPEATAEQTAEAQADLGPADGATAPAVDAPRAEALPDAALEPTAAVADTAPAWRATELPIVPSAAAPTFVRKRTRAPSPRAPLWQWLALVALGLLLALQILLADRARLATDASWRPALSALCGVFGCALPPWDEPAAFTMLDRDVRPAPNESGTLRIQASFRNDARWAQAWPWLQLSLSDADGRVIGSRVFAPAEYLGHAPEGPDLLAPGQSARIDFRVREPAAGTAAFNFEFR